MEGINKLADVINSYIEPNYTVVFPAGRYMDLIVLRILVDDNIQIYLASGFFGDSTQIELAMLYRKISTYVNGTYISVYVNISDDEFLSIVDKYNVGAIVEYWAYRLDHERILQLFPEAIFVEVDKKYTCLLYTSPSPRDRG